MARVAQDHDAAIFCVGLEFTHAQKFTERWLQIIAAVRAVYFGKLTYGVNWNEYESVKFWDALDYLGVLAYFPLTKATNPSAADLAAGWQKRCAEMDAFLETKRRQAIHLCGDRLQSKRQSRGRAMEF